MDAIRTLRACSSGLWVRRGLAVAMVERVAALLTILCRYFLAMGGKACARRARPDLDLMAAAAVSCSNTRCITRLS